MRCREKLIAMFWNLTDFQKVLPSTPQVAFRNAKSLKDHLVKPKLKPEPDVTEAVVQR